MSKRLKYVALITVDRTIYEYYGNANYEFGLAEEKPTFKLNQPLPPNVKVIPTYCTTVEVSPQLASPLRFVINNYSIYIEKILSRGGEAIIYQGTLNQRPVVFRKYLFLSRKLRSLPPEIYNYVPRKYLLFNDGEDIPILVMEQLKELVFTNRIYEQSLLFLQQMEALNEVHGDISPSNVMQNNEGNVKFIDFSRSTRNKGTKFYSKERTDRQAMAIVLLNYKYRDLVKEHCQSLGLIHNDHRKYTLGNLYKLKGMDESAFFNWIEHTFPQDQQSSTLFGMIRC